MSERSIDVLSIRPADVVPQPRAGWRPTAHGAGRSENSGALGAGGNFGWTGRTSREPLGPRQEPAAGGGFVPADDELLERTLAFSGSYVSDDGNVTIRRFAVGSFEYSGDRFVGNCILCSRALLIPATGEPLADVRAAVHFVAAHSHGDVD
jgi:hypothetical protein